jgi:hypothetical protein
MVAHDYNESTWELWQEDLKFDVTLCDTVRSCLKNKQTKQQ